MPSICRSIKNVVIRDKETPCIGTLTVDLSEYVEEVVKNNNPKYSISFLGVGEEEVTINGSNLEIQLFGKRPKETSAYILVTSDIGNTSIGITVKFENLCSESECAETQFCDECTGLCEEGEVDIDATVPTKGKVKFI